MLPRAEQPGRSCGIRSSSGRGCRGLLEVDLLAIRACCRCLGDGRFLGSFGPATDVGDAPGAGRLEVVSADVPLLPEDGWRRCGSRWWLLLAPFVPLPGALRPLTADGSRPQLRPRDRPAQPRGRSTHRHDVRHGRVWRACPDRCHRRQAVPAGAQDLNVNRGAVAPRSDDSRR